LIKLKQLHSIYTGLCVSSFVTSYTKCVSLLCCFSDLNCS